MDLLFIFRHFGMAPRRAACSFAMSRDKRRREICCRSYIELQEDVHHNCFIVGFIHLHHNLCCFRQCNSPFTFQQFCNIWRNKKRREKNALHIHDCFHSNLHSDLYLSLWTYAFRKRITNPKTGEFSPVFFYCERGTSRTPSPTTDDGNSHTNPRTTYNPS